MTEYTDDEHAQLGAARQAVTELRQTEATLDKLRTAALEGIASSALGEERLREKLYFSVQAIDALRSALLAEAEGGKVIEHNALIRSLVGEGEG